MVGLGDKLSRWQWAFKSLCGSEYNDWDIAEGGKSAEIGLSLPGRATIAFHIVDNQMGLLLSNHPGCPVRTGRLECLDTLPFQQYAQNFTGLARGINNQDPPLGSFMKSLG